MKIFINRQPVLGLWTRHAWPAAKKGPGAGQDSISQVRKRSQISDLNLKSQIGI